MIDLCIADTFCKINLFQHIAKLELPCLGIDFITLARFEAMVISLFCFFKFAEYFLQASFSDALFGFGGNLYLSLIIIVCDIPFLS